MSLELRELLRACTNADTDKASDRKRWSEQIKVMLDKKTICFKLHNGEGGQCCWDVIFKSAVRIFEKDHLAACKSKSGKSNKRTHDNLFLLKTVLKNSSTDGQIRLKPASVIKLLNKFLSVDDTKEMYAQDFLSCVFKYFLSLKEAWINLDHKLAAELIRHLKDIMTEQQSGISFDQLSVSRYLCACIEHVINSKTGLPEDFASQSNVFFKQLRSSVISGSSVELCEYLLRICNLVMTSWFPDLRNFFCQQGEEVFLSLLNIWKRRPQEKLKIQLAMFYRMQILLHHPCGMIKEESGAYYATDFEEWKNMLKELLHVLVYSLNETTTRGRFSSNNSESSEELNCTFVDLISELLLVLEGLDGEFFLEGDVPCPTVEGTCPPLAKRRKVTGNTRIWDWIHGTIKSNPSKAFAWTEILHSLISKYPTVIPPEDLITFAEDFILLLHEDKRACLFENTLKCLSMIISTLHKSHSDTLKKLNLVKNLTQLVESLITARRAVDQSFVLLTRLLEFGLYTPSEDLWMLFRHDFIKPSSPSLNFILSFLANCIQTSDFSFGHRSLRLLLIRWLLPENEIFGEEGSTPSMASFGVLTTDNFPNLKLAASALSMICMTKPKLCYLNAHSSDLVSMDSFPYQHLYDSFTEKSLQAAGKLLLMTSLNNFELGFLENAAFESRLEVHQSQDLTNVSLLPSMNKDIFEILLRDLQHFSLLGCNLELQQLEKQTMMCCLALEFLFVSHKEWKCPLSDAKFSQIIERLKVSFQKLFENMSAYFLHSNLPEAKHMVKALLGLLEGCAPPAESDCAKLLRNILPSGYPDFFLKLIKSQSTAAPGDKEDHDDDDDDDLFECITPMPSQSGREINDFFDNSQQESSNSSMPSVGLHPSRRATEDDQIRIATTQWLCAWMSLYAGDNSYIISELLSLSSMCDSMRMKHGIIAALTSVPQLEDDVINQIVDLIRSLSEKSSSKDQGAIKVIFNLLISISPHLNGEALQCVSNIISYYWRIMQDNYNEQTCLSLVACTLALLKNNTLRNNDLGDQMLSMCNYACMLLRKNKFIFRILAVHIIPSLFESFESFETQIYSLSKSNQQKIFQSLETVISELIEDGSIPISSFLHCLIAIWKSSLVCQKKVIQFLLRIKKHYPSMSLPLFHKILSHLAEVEGSSNQIAFVTKQLLHVIKFWLETGYSIKDFPFQILLSADIAEFLRTYSKMIIPDLAANTKHHSELEEVRSILGKTKKELIVENLPEILILLLPFLAAVECRSDKYSQSKVDDALECCKRLPGVKNFKTSLQEHLIKMIQGIFFSYYDVDEMNLITEHGLGGDSNYPEPDSLHFNKSNVLLIINYLMSLCKASNFVQLISMVPDGLQIVVVEITSAFHEQTSIFEKLRNVMSLELFTSLLIPNLQLISDNSLPFLMQHLFTFSTNFLHLAMTKMATNAFKGRQILEMDQIMRIVCNMFTSFVRASADISPREVTYYLPLIVSSAVDLVRSHRSNMGLEILKLLYCQIGGEITEALKKLDPLPAIVIEHLGLNDGHEVDMNLKEVVEKFLATDVYFKEASDVGEVILNRNHGVEALLTSIRANLCDLPQFVSNIKSDAMELSVNQYTDFLYLFNLMKTQFEMLLKRRGYEDAELLNIASCLGSLGPINFDHALEIEQVLNAEEFPLMSLNDEISLHCTVIKRYLSKYLVDRRTEVVRMTCNVLKHLLQCEKGRNALKRLEETEGKNSRICQTLHPFVHGQKGELQIGVTCDMVSLLSSDDTWKSFKASSQAFVLNLVSSTEFVGDEFLVSLGPICKLKVGLSRFLLPHLVHKILSIPGPSLVDHISNHFEMIISDFVERNDSSDETIEDILHVVQYLRSKPKDKGTAWDSNFWLRIDFLLLAQASLKKNKFYSALLFSELHCLHTADIGHKEIQSVWMEAYNNIDDIDSIHGCGNRVLLEPCNRMKMLERNKEWNKSLVLSDMHLSHNTLTNCPQSTLSHASISLMKSLQKLSCHYLLDFSLSKHQEFQVSEDVKEMQYQAAWEMSNWDLNVIENLNEKSGYHEMIYGSLKALKDQNFPLLDFHVASARKNLVKSVVTNEYEGMCMASLKPILAKLRCLSELEELANVLKEKPVLIEEVLTRWHSERYSNNFDDIELLMKQRCVVSQLIQAPVVPSSAFSQICTPSSCASSLSNDGIYHNHVEQIILQLSKHALQAGRLELAEKSIMMMKEMSPDIENLSAIQDWQLEEAKIFRARGELDTAKYLIKRLVDRQENSNLGAKCLLLYGDILVETQSETPTVIMESLYKKAVKMLDGEVTTSETSVDAFYSLASYADAQYKMKVEYMESPAHDDKLELMNQAREEISKMKAKNQPDVKIRYLKTLEKQLKIDDSEMQQLNSDCKQFLIYSLENYLKCLQRSPKYDSSMYRLISLWFNNLGDGKVDEVLARYALQISSHKFVPLMYQLAARMNLSKGLFQTTLANVVANAATDHPHHVLPIILSLAHANLDDSLAKNIRRSTSRNSGNNQNEVPDEERMVAAQNLITRLKRKVPNHIQLLTNQMELLSRAYIELANWNVDSYKGETKAIKFPVGMTLLQMSHHPSVAVATMEIPVSPSGKYNEIIHVLKVENTFSLAGGINLPKIITCRCSDGVKRKQLVKGKDDLRQDAVMQQVFNSVNGFLKSNDETRKRNLRIRTYKVVPLSQRSGLLEWCADTEPLGDYLSNPVTGAHQRYRPQDLKPIDCRKQMNMVHGTTDENEKLATYLNICKRFQPVFRHFFMEKFLDATKWFQKRLAYTRSVATTSIVGYMLGLGDRHVQNILIDVKLAELIHIDFGVAFEQGWNLPTPETVPFRLTRDLVDGMGVTGVEGVFRRCCEKTMMAMRANREVLMTIIEVFLYDPLYDWAMSPTKAFQVQNRHNLTLDSTESSENDVLTGKSDDTHLNKVAKRVLLRLDQKLCGFEGSIQLSVEGHVSRLILQATDPKNLSRLFPGWQPYI